MALLFPISASIGQTYQSGSSNTYEWTGTYWKIKNVINFNEFSASVVDRIIAATNEGQFATTGSNTFIGGQVISGSILLSGSIIPTTPSGSFTSSFSLGSPTNAWKDLYISHGSIIFVDATTQETSSFTIENNAGGQNTVKYTAAITASAYLGDGRQLTNLSANTNWNNTYDSYLIRKTEQLTFSGDYILENAFLLIEGSVTSSIGEWIPANLNGDGIITRTSDNTYRIDGPNDGDNDGYLIIKKYFDTEATLSIDYEWSSQDDTDYDRPVYDVTEFEPFEFDTTNRLRDTNSQSETGTWTINVPADRWVAIGVYSTDSEAGSGSLSVTLPYQPNEDEIQYSANKSFKREGTIFIGGNLLLKDSSIYNDGKISVGGEVILIGNSQILGNGIII
jgi:hypothetical protein